MCHRSASSTASSTRRWAEIRRRSVVVTPVLLSTYHLLPGGRRPRAVHRHTGRLRLRILRHKRSGATISIVLLVLHYVLATHTKDRCVLRTTPCALLHCYLVRTTDCRNGAAADQLATHYLLRTYCRPGAAADQLCQRAAARNLQRARLRGRAGSE